MKSVQIVLLFSALSKCLYYALLYMPSAQWLPVGWTQLVVAALQHHT